MCFIGHFLSHGHQGRVPFSCLYRVGVCDNFGIDPIPSKYKASIDSDTDSDTCHLKKHK